MEAEHVASGRGMRGWTPFKPSDPNQMLELVFAVKQTNLNFLEEILLEVSDPTSERYGKHLSNRAVHQLVAPLPEHVKTVMEFLKLHNVEPEALTMNSDFIGAKVPVSVAEQILDCEYYEYKHIAGGSNVNRCDQYSLPEDVAEAVDFVSPTIKFPSRKRLNFDYNVFTNEFET